MKVINSSNIENALVGDVIVTVAVCDTERNILDEFDSIKEARKFVKDEGYSNVEFWYLAAETINEQGDLNPACWGRTKKEAIAKLKKVLP